MEMILACTCEDARARSDGRLDITGIFDELQAPGFPAVQDRMTVVFVMEWAPDQEGRREFRADLEDDAGTRVLTIEGHTDVSATGPRSPRTQLLMPLERVIFPHAGVYRFHLTVDGTTLDALTLRVSEDTSDS